MLETLSAFLATATGQTTAIAFVLDFVFRLIKTEQPLSIAHAAAAGAHKIADLIGGIASFLDKVLPQRTK